MNPLPNKKYKIIYADPPWKYDSDTPLCLPEKKPETCKIGYYYNTMELGEITSLPINEICDKDCVLFLWATTPLIRKAFEVMKKWGFKYKTMITWEKTDKDCMGYWFRVCTEHLLVGVKGKIKSFRSMERTCYHEKRRKHSQKPDYFRKLIVKSCGDLPRIELFARKRVEGWDAWGNEIPNETQNIIK